MTIAALFLSLGAVGIGFWEIARLVARAEDVPERDFTGEFEEGER